MPGVFGGSSGVTSATRIEAVIEEFLRLPTASQTSARFANLWSSRAVHYLDVRMDYIIPAEGNTAAGWSSYVYRLHGSTRNGTSGGVYGILGIPDPVYREFLADRTVLQAATSAITGTADADQGRRLYQFLFSTDINSEKYRLGGQHRELLMAWSAAGSSAAPTSG